MTTTQTNIKNVSIAPQSSPLPPSGQPLLTQRHPLFWFLSPWLSFICSWTLHKRNHLNYLCLVPCPYYNIFENNPCGCTDQYFALSLPPPFFFFYCWDIFDSHALKWVYWQSLKLRRGERAGGEFPFSRVLLSPYSSSAALTSCSQQECVHPKAQGLSPLTTCALTESKATGINPSDWESTNLFSYTSFFLHPNCTDLEEQQSWETTLGPAITRQVIHYDLLRSHQPTSSIHQGQGWVLPCQHAQILPEEPYEVEFAYMTKGLIHG